MKIFTFPFSCSLIALAALSLAGSTAPAASGGSAAGGQTRLSDYVKPFVGTKGEGNTYPGPSTPFGMVQFGPDTDDVLWDTASGYEYTDTSIMGFSCTHLTGTGIPDLGDFLFMPQIGEPKFVPGSKEKPEEGYRQKYSHADEAASCGYYRVKLANGVNVELTAADRAGVMRFTFPKSDQASIMTDLSHLLNGKRFKIIWSHIRVENNQTVTGFHLVNGWGKERYIYFAARYSKPFEDHLIMTDGKPHIYNTYRFRSSNEAAGANLQFLAKYKTNADEVIQVKIGISPVSAENAMKNLDADIPDWNFQNVVEQACTKWDNELKKIEIQGTQEEKETFYSGMYHAFLAPNMYQDVTGEYRGFDQNIHQAKGFTRYAVFSLWDTFRAEHPLFALIQSNRDSDMINSLLTHYDQSVDHLLPMWELDGNETWCMIGYHAVPVIVDGYLKGVKGFDVGHAYEAIKATAMNPDYDSVATFAKLGWVPFDKENESLSKTLEYAYDDYCVAQLAKALGKTDDYDYFMKLSGNYKNIFDATVGWMRPKDSQGKWRTPFDPHDYGGGQANFGDITEGTSAQYSWFVPQDVPGLIELMGGKDAFVKKLDALFEYKGTVTTGENNDIQGRIGEYWHGNEPSHHIIYLYCYAGQPWKAAQRIHEVIKTQYGNKPDSLSGNDDCGQMSAWYIFSVMGFYPVCPASGYYVIGSPCLPKVTMHLSNGKDLAMTAENLSDKNIYIQSVKVNGKDWNSPFLPHSQIKDGGSIAFTMGPEPSKWGTNPVIPK